METIILWCRLRFGACVMASGILLFAHSAVAKNCANIAAQAIAASGGFFAQCTRAFEVCNDPQKFDKLACIAQSAVVAQAAVWTWWTVSTWVCDCLNVRQDKYCTAFGIVPKPPNPNGNQGAAPVAPGLPEELESIDERMQSP